MEGSHSSTAKRSSFHFEQTVAFQTNTVVFFSFTKMATCFGLRDDHPAIITNILQIRYISVKIMLTKWDGKVYVNVKNKKVASEQDTKAQRARISIALLFLQPRR